jgi:pseudouridine-5'-phosphate glycosidase
VIDVSEEVRRAGVRAVALETSVVAQGLPPPHNLEAARRCAEAVRAAGAVPAFVAIVAGRIVVGANADDLARLGDPSRRPAKAGSRDLAALCAFGRDAGTTVGATCRIAARAGLRVFATGGIGGVHRFVSGDRLRLPDRLLRPSASARRRLSRLSRLLRTPPQPPPGTHETQRRSSSADAQSLPPAPPRPGTHETLDISSDLVEMARNPVCVVSAGPKAILDVPATAEALETLGVPVIGWRTSELPAFYTEGSGISLEHRVDDAGQMARLLRAHWDELGQESGVLLAVAPPSPLPGAEIEAAIDLALVEAGTRGLSGKELTPFLLARIAEETSGRSLSANLDLLENNARVAGAIAVALAASS